MRHAQGRRLLAVALSALALLTACTSQKAADEPDNAPQPGTLRPRLQRAR